MYTKFDTNPLRELYDAIDSELEWLLNNKEEDSFYYGNLFDDDKICKLILENNGCGFGENARFHPHTLEFDNSITIAFAYDCKANDANEFYDYIEFYGHKYIFIFMDYFDKFFEKRVSDDDNSVEGNLKRAMGKSIYFDAIKKIVELFISITSPVTGMLNATAAANNYRYAPIFIAATILDHYVSLREEDVSSMDFNMLNSIIDKISLDLLLLGVKVIED